MVLTSAPPLRFLVPRNHPSFTCPNQRSSNPSVRRREVASVLSEVAMRPCDFCKKNNKQCLVGHDSDRCSSCVASGKKCDLVVSPVEMRRIEGARKTIRSEIRATVAKLARLQAEEDRIEEEKRKLVERDTEHRGVGTRRAWQCF